MYLLTTLLECFAQPTHSKDRLAFAIVVRDLQSLLFLIAGGLVVGAGGLPSWDSRPLRVLVEVASAAIVVGLVHVGITVRRLCVEMAFRALCRSKRLTLPPVLADGIVAAEMKDVPKVAGVISLRLCKVRHFSDQSIRVFDCLMFDLLECNPGLSKDLRRIARATQKKA